MERVLFYLSIFSLMIVLTSGFVVNEDEHPLDVVGEKPPKLWEMVKFQEMGKAKSDLLTFLEKPPKATAAQMARFVVNQADWGSIATISAHGVTAGYPYAAIVSISDGPVGKGKGIPYMTFSMLSTTTKNAQKDPRVTLLMSLVQGDYCTEHKLDPIDPRCSRINLTGKLVKIKKDDEEYESGKKMFRERHPFLTFLPPGHGFYLAKIEIDDVALLDGFGGAKHIPLKDYLEVSFD